MTLIERLEKAGEGSRLMLVDLNAAPFTREFLDALNGYATGGSGRCLDTLSIWNARLAASPSVGGWEDDPYLATDLALVNDVIYQHGGDAALAGWVRLCRRITAAPPPPSVSTGSRPQEAVPAEQADGVVVGLPEPLVFGLGALVVNTGFYGGKPAVFIARATEPGVVGAETGRAAFARDCLQPGERVMTFPSTEQANAVADAMCAFNLEAATPQPADGCSSNEGAE